VGHSDDGDLLRRGGLRGGVVLGTFYRERVAAVAGGRNRGYGGYPARRILFRVCVPDRVPRRRDARRHLRSGSGVGRCRSAHGRHPPVLCSSLRSPELSPRRRTHEHARRDGRAWLLGRLVTVFPRPGRCQWANWLGGGRPVDLHRPPVPDPPLDGAVVRGGGWLDGTHTPRRLGHLPASGIATPMFGRRR